MSLSNCSLENTFLLASFSSFLWCIRSAYETLQVSYLAVYLTSLEVVSQQAMLKAADTLLNLLLNTQMWNHSKSQ